MTARHRKLGRIFRAQFHRNNPRRNDELAVKLAEIETSLSQHGVWREEYEWRIFTWFQNEITPQERSEGRIWYKVVVTCDDQLLTCNCPSIFRAFLFLEHYKDIILCQFYSVGPPWAGETG